MSFATSALSIAAARLETEEIVGANSWARTARPDQLPPPGDWFVWLILAGRGWGKSRTAAEWCLAKARRYPGCRIALVASTASDTRDTMIEGESGLLNCADPEELRGGSIDNAWNRSLGELFLGNGSRFKTYTSERPRKLRGPQHHFCFPAGTTVQTPNGARSIEDLVVGDLVMTRRGPRKVSITGSRMASLATMRHASGSLTGTVDHPVWTENRGWTPLGSLSSHDTLLVWADDGHKTYADITTDTLKTQTLSVDGVRSGVIVKSGKTPTDRSHRAFRFITEITYQVMTDSKISKLSRQNNTVKSTQMYERQVSVDGVEICSNTQVKVDRRGTVSSVRVLLEKPPGSRSRVGVSTVIQSTSPDGIGVRGSVVSDVSISGLVGRVYNISVEGEHEYFADGVLVHNCWADEAAFWTDAYKGPITDTTWSNLVIGTRLPRMPGWDDEFRTQVVVATTPRPVALLRTTDEHPSRRGLMQRETTIMTRGRTVDNLANLSENYRAQVVAPLVGTRLGRQELDGELLDERDDALWTRTTIDETRVDPDNVPDLVRIVVGVDPAVTDGESAAETGIVVVGASRDGHGYVLADYTLRGSPKQTMKQVVDAFHRWKADRVVAEVNNGGDYIGTLLHTIDPNIPYRKVTATRGKAVRAEPVSALYEQRRVHHAGSFPQLEDQMVTWAPMDEVSPDRMDALVWAITDLKDMISGSWMDAYGVIVCQGCTKLFVKAERTACPQCGLPIAEVA